MKAPTLPGRLMKFADEIGDQVAIRDKKLGIWQEYSWRAYRDNVAAAARMLWELGVRPGDGAAILSDNRPEWLYADLGAQSIGAYAVGVYQTNPPADVAYVVNDSGSKVLFCEDQEQYDKAIAIRDETPEVTHVVVFDPRGTRAVHDPRRMAWSEFIDRGHALLDEDPGWFAARVAELDPETPTMIVYTSGTTGVPKGAMLSSYNVLAAADQFVEEVNITAADSVLSYLPLCHVAEKIFSIFLSLAAGVIVHFGESLATVQRDLREVSPTIFLGVPRIWEKMASSVNVKMHNSSWLKRTLYDMCAARGATIATRRRQATASTWDTIVWWLADALVFRPLQERLGLRRCRIPFSGAAPISADLLRWYHGIGVPICEGYGMTESSGVSHYNPLNKQKLGTVGIPAPTLECHVAKDGEVLLRGPSVFSGYLNKPEATAEVMDRDGWLHTGDIGAIDEDGYLSITGRKKEIIITAGGKNLSPEKIENALKTSMYVKEAVAIGDQRKFIAALVQIDYDTVGDWAIRRRIPYTSYEDLAGKGEIEKLIGDEIDKANALLANVESVRQFRILPKELHQDDGELTATQKVRRRFVHSKFNDLIESIYQ